MDEKWISTKTHYRLIKDKLLELENLGADDEDLILIKANLLHSHYVHLVDTEDITIEVYLGMMEEAYKGYKKLNEEET